MSLNIVVSADVAAAGKQIDDFSKKSRTALTSLSLVAQDLPFGFIGIQNNLPGVISSFGELTREAGGVGGALKQLGSSLIGPAGLFLAFSAVTAGVTYLIQKYGSLSAAVTALVSNNAKLVQVQNALNKELATSLGNTAGETAKIQILVKTMSDLSKPMKDRQDAYIALKKIAPEIARGIDEENLLTKKNIDLVNENARARIEYIKIRARESAILNIVNKNEEERIALEQQYPALLDKKQKAELAYNKTKGLSFDATKTFNAGLNIEALNLQSATDALNKNATQRRELYKINDGLINQLTPLVEGTSKYDAATKAFTESLKKQKKEKSDELDILELERKGRYAALKLQEQADKNRLKYLQDQLRLENELTKATFAQADVNMKADAEAFSKENFKKLSEFTKPLDELQKSFEATKFFLQDIFFNPLQDLFKNFLDTGKLTFKEFGKVVLDSIKKIVAQIAAQQVIQLLAQVLNPMGALASTGVLTNTAVNAGKGQKGILGALSNIFLGRVANPNFGGVDRGQMGMSGSVNLVLRGTDLVGSINRTNAQISRVG
jgi:hypothetical protein